jgi:uracil-DNA glycosylase
MGVTEEEFYDVSRVAVVPMGFCFPGLDANGGDLPPRRECAPLWRDRVLGVMPEIELMLLVGSYAQRWHLGDELVGLSLTETVARWHSIHAMRRTPRMLPLPHPSWRNNAWIKRNPWFEADLLPVLRRACRKLLTPK